MTAEEAMRHIDSRLSHVWMVRAFLKHCDEAEEDEELCQVHRALYDFMLALGGPLESGDAGSYVKQAAKKYSKLVRATDLFREIQPEVSQHTNFRMAVQSLTTAANEIGEVLRSVGHANVVAKSQE